MRDLINIAVAKLEKKRAKKYFCNSICSLSSLDLIKKTKGAANLSPADMYEDTFANLNLVGDIYCKNSLGELIPIKMDFNTNIVLPELI